MKERLKKELVTWLFTPDAGKIKAMEKALDYRYFKNEKVKTLGDEYKRRLRSILKNNI